MNKEEKRLSKYLGKILDDKPLLEEESSWKEFMELLTQDLLDNPPKPYSCICGGELKMFGDEFVGYLECVECKNTAMNWVCGENE